MPRSDGRPDPCSSVRTCPLPAAPTRPSSAGRNAAARHPDLQPEPARVEAGLYSEEVDEFRAAMADAPIEARAHPRGLSAQLRVRGPRDPREVARLADRVAAGGRRLGAPGVVLHPGSALKGAVDAALERAAATIARGARRVRDLPAAPRGHRRRRRDARAHLRGARRAHRAPPAARAARRVPGLLPPARLRLRRAHARGRSPGSRRVRRGLGLDRLGSLHLNDSQIRSARTTTATRPRRGRARRGRLRRRSCASPASRAFRASSSSTAPSERTPTSRASCATRAAPHAGAGASLPARDGVLRPVRQPAGGPRAVLPELRRAADLGWGGEAAPPAPRAGGAAAPEPAPGAPEPAPAPEPEPRPRTRARARTGAQPLSAAPGGARRPARRARPDARRRRRGCDQRRDVRGRARGRVRARRAARARR